MFPAICLFVVMLLSPIGGESIAAVVAKETRVRALYILNFANFIRWPQSNLQDSRVTIICTLSNNEVGKQMQKIIDSTPADDKVAIRQVVPMNLLKHCHIVYIDDSDAASLSTIFTVLKPFPVLTVSALPGFIEQGGNIGFLRTEKQLGLYSDKRVQYEINMQQTKAVKLQLDPRLLELATRIIGG